LKGVMNKLELTCSQQFGSLQYVVERIVLKICEICNVWTRINMLTGI